MNRNRILLAVAIFSIVAAVAILAGAYWPDQTKPALDLAAVINDSDPGVIAVDVLASEKADIAVSFTDKLAGTGRTGAIGSGRSFRDTRMISVVLGHKNVYLSGSGTIAITAKTADGRANSTKIVI